MGGEGAELSETSQQLFRLLGERARVREVVELSDGFYDRRFSKPKFSKPKFDRLGNLVFNPRVRDENELSDNQMLRTHSRHGLCMAAPLRVFW